MPHSQSNLGQLLGCRALDLPPPLCFTCGNDAPFRPNPTKQHNANKHSEQRLKTMSINRHYAIYHVNQIPQNCWQKLETKNENSNMLSSSFRFGFTTEAPVTRSCFLLRFRLCFQNPAKNHNIVNSLFKAAIYVGGIGTHTSTQLALNSETLTLCYGLYGGAAAPRI